MKFRLLALLAFILLAVPAAAQPSRTAVGIGEDFRVCMTPPAAGGETLSANRRTLDFWVGPPSAPTLRILQVQTTQLFSEEPDPSGTGLTLRLLETRTAVTEVK